MLKRLVLCLVVVCSTLLLGYPLSPHLAAAIKEIKASHRFLMGDNTTKVEAQNIARQQATRKALERAGVYIESITEVKNMALTQDIVRSYTAGIAAVDVIDERTELVGESPAVIVTVNVRVDEDDVVRQIKALRRDWQKTRELAEARKKIKAAEQQIITLSRELSRIKKAKQPERVKQIQQERRRAITEIDVQSFLAKAAVTLSGRADGSAGYGTVPKEKISEARSYVEQAYEKEPDNSDVLGALGELAAHESDFVKAEDYYRQSIKRNPNNGCVYAGLGFTFYYRGKLESAYKDSPFAHFFRGFENFISYLGA